MEAWSWGVGVLLAMFGPLLLLPVAWALYRWPFKWLFGKLLARRFGPAAGRVRFGLALLVLSVAAIVSWLPGRLGFSRLCEVHAEPVIVERVDVDGFFRNRMFAYEAEEYLRQAGFAYVEAPDPYKAQRFLRYQVGADGRTEAVEIAAPQARYAVEVTFSDLGDFKLSQKRISERASGAELARAGSVTFNGGPLGLILGVYGTAHCPTPRSAEGARQFDDFFYLERKVLRQSSPSGR